MSISTLIRRMSEAGAPAEAIALAVEEIEAVQASLDARRVADRDRKRAQREREKSADVTGHSEDCPETVTDKGSLEVPPRNPLPKPSKSSPYIPPKIRSSFPEPEGVSAEQWAAFRKQRKKALSDRSYTLLTNKLIELADAGHDPGAMIDLAIERGWETVFAPRDFANGKGGKPAYVSASGYEYRGDLDSVIREATRRGDTQTRWLAESHKRNPAHA